MEAFLPLPATDKDECKNSSICPPTAKCKNVPGRYYCICNPGFVSTDGRDRFTGSGATCIGEQILHLHQMKMFLYEGCAKQNKNKQTDKKLITKGLI